MFALKQNFRTSEQKKVGKLFRIYQIGSMISSAADLRVYSLDPFWGSALPNTRINAEALLYSSYVVYCAHSYNIRQRRLLFTFFDSLE